MIGLKKAFSGFFTKIGLNKIMKEDSRINTLIDKSKLISRDLSWLKFNYRVLDQVKHPNRNLFEKLKFLAITAMNLDEFFMIRVGSLYNYIDYRKERIDYSGLRELPFKKKLFYEIQQFYRDQTSIYLDELQPKFRENGLVLLHCNELLEHELEKVNHYFKRTVFPMLTPMVYDSYHPFPMLMNKTLIFGVVTINHEESSEKRKLSFIQIPLNLPRFYEIERDEVIVFVPIEDIIRTYIHKFFRNVNIESTSLFRVIRNGDFTLEESDDIEANFLEELKRKLKTRRTGRVVRLEIEENPNNWLLRILKTRWELDDDNIFEVKSNDIIDYSSFWQIVNNVEFKNRLPVNHPPVPPVTYPENGTDDILEVLKNRDIFLHHPYNSIEPLLNLIESASEDPKVLAIKITIYRLAKESRIVNALLKAAENGKHVSVLFEVKARFDEENNITEAKKLQEAGCFVIYGIENLKTHTKLTLIVRKEGEKVTRYVHMSSGNYNETTSRLYTDIGLLTTQEIYAHDVSEFFNAITGHSQPMIYENLITAPNEMRQRLLDLIIQEAENARQGLPSGIAIKINSLQDKLFINELYKASQAGVPIKLIVRGICCLRPGRKDLSENIEVLSIVGEYLEHSRIYYFHNNGDPMVYSGSADVMVRSFDRRIESLFRIIDPVLRQQCINILHFNMLDNTNTYIMNEDGTYTLKSPNGSPPFNLHKEFFKVTINKIMPVKIF